MSNKHNKKYKFKSQKEATTHLIEWLKIKRMIILSTAKYC